jgi:hypothetical protein
MDDIQLLKLRNQGYCCTQIMVIMVLDMWGEQNPSLVDFSGGLCMGAGMEQGPCGILTGGMGILAMYAGKDKDRLIPMQEAFASFFIEQTRACGGTGCADIAGDHYPAPDPETCGRLLKTSYDGLMAILVENGCDPADPPDRN